MQKFSQGLTGKTLLLFLSFDLERQTLPVWKVASSQKEESSQKWGAVFPKEAGLLSLSILLPDEKARCFLFTTPTLGQRPSLSPHPERDRELCLALCPKDVLNIQRDLFALNISVFISKPFFYFLRVSFGDRERKDCCWILDVVLGAFITSWRKLVVRVWEKPPRKDQ